jgi:hypothetical protein
MFSPTADPRPARSSWREAVRRAVDLAVAFATLSDELPPHGPADEPAVHPHRQALRAPSRARRPGRVAPRVHICLTPLPSRATRPAPASQRSRHHTSSLR